MIYYKKHQQLIFISITILIILPSLAIAQVTREWVRTFDLDYHGDVIELTNGRYLFTKYTDNREYIIIRTNGRYQDSLSYAGYDDTGFNLEQIDNDKVITTMLNYGDDARFALLSIYDGVLWDSESFIGSISSIHKYNNNFIATGVHRISATNENAVVVRYDSNGMIIWHSEYDEQGMESARDACISVTGNIYVIISNGLQLRLKIIDESGDEINEYQYDGSWIMSPHAIEMMPDGNLFVKGTFYFTQDDANYAMILSPDGDLLTVWDDPYTGDYWDNDVWLLPDGGFLSTHIGDIGQPFHYEIEFICYDGSWNELWRNSEVDFEGRYSAVNSYTGYITSDRSMLFYGQFQHGDYEWDALLLKYDLAPSDLEIDVFRYSNRGVPAPGRFYWHGTLINNTDADINTAVWVIVRGPDGYPSEPLRVWEDITVPANGTYEADLRQNIPADAASGEYNYIVRAGLEYNPGQLQHSIQAYFPLTITGGAAVDLDPPRVRGVVAAPFEGPAMVELAPEVKKAN